MSGLLEHVQSGGYVVAPCPNCGGTQDWWIPGHRRRGTDEGLDETGLACGSDGCGFALNLNQGPPDIMCAVCGDVLKQTSDDDIKFQCQGCGRTVTP